MVLGPAAEFAIEAPDDAKIDVPPGWQALPVKRMKVA
jgi:hypothetical protein